MKWMITSVLAATFNVVIILMFTASKLGPTPLFLPLILAVVALAALVGSIVSVVVGKTRHQDFRALHLVAVAPWVIAIGFNLWAFQGILYVI
jgi:type III secretory pathway component EscS